MKKVVKVIKKFGLFWILFGIFIFSIFCSKVKNYFDILPFNINN